MHAVVSPSVVATLPDLDSREARPARRSHRPRRRSTRRTGSGAPELGGFLTSDAGTSTGHRRLGRRQRAARPRTHGRARLARSRTTRTPRQRRDRPAAPKPADARSPILLFQVVEHVMGWSSLAWIAAVLGKALLCELDVTLGNRNLARPLGDAVPEGLQITDLLR